MTMRVPRVYQPPGFAVQLQALIGQVGQAVDAIDQANQRRSAQWQTTQQGRWLELAQTADAAAPHVKAADYGSEQEYLTALEARQTGVFQTVRDQATQGIDPEDGWRMAATDEGLANLRGGATEAAMKNGRKQWGTHYATQQAEATNQLGVAVARGKLSYEDALAQTDARRAAMEADGYWTPEHVTAANHQTRAQVTGLYLDERIADGDVTEAERVLAATGDLDPSKYAVYQRRIDSRRSELARVQMATSTQAMVAEMTAIEAGFDVDPARAEAEWNTLSPEQQASPKALAMRERLTAARDLQSDIGQVMRQSPADSAQAVQAAMAAVKDDPAQARRAQALAAAHDRKIKALREDPIALAQQLGVVTAQPIDWSSAESVAAAQARAQHVSEVYSVAAPLMTKAEAAQARTLIQARPDAALAMTGQLTGLYGDDEDGLDATLQQLGGEDAALHAAITTLAYRPELGEAALAGLKIDQNPEARTLYRTGYDGATKESEVFRQLHQAVGGQAIGLLRRQVEMIYLGKLAQRGSGYAGTADPELLNDVIAEVTHGGPMDWAGGMIVPPWEGATERDVQAALTGWLKQYDGQFGDDWGKREAWQEAIDDGDLQLRSVADGQYHVLGLDGQPLYDPKGSGDWLLVNLSTVTPDYSRPGAGLNPFGDATPEDIVAAYTEGS